MSFGVKKEPTSQTKMPQRTPIITSDGIDPRRPISGVKKLSTMYAMSIDRMAGMVMEEKKIANDTLREAKCDDE